VGGTEGGGGLEGRTCRKIDGTRILFNGQSTSFESYHEEISLKKLKNVNDNIICNNSYKLKASGQKLKWVSNKTK
jgi:hypothetical protein